MLPKFILPAFVGFVSIAIAPIAIALPPPEDIPEEVLRTEIITEARSPIDGEPLTAAEYVQLRAELEEGNPEFYTIDPTVSHVVFQLRILRLFRTITPF